MNYITRQNILLRLTSPDTIFVLYANNECFFINKTGDEHFPSPVDKCTVKVS